MSRSEVAGGTLESASLGALDAGVPECERIHVVGVSTQVEAGALGLGVEREAPSRLSLLLSWQTGGPPQASEFAVVIDFPLKPVGVEATFQRLAPATEGGSE